MKSTEKETQKACLQLLEMKRIFHYRQNSGAFKAEHGSFIRYGTPGAPDIVMVISGRYIGVEVKDIKGRQNENQKDFQQRLENAGGEYIIVKSIDDLINYLNQCGNRLAKI